MYHFFSRDYKGIKNQSHYRAKYHMYFRKEYTLIYKYPKFWCKKKKSSSLTWVTPTRISRLTDEPPFIISPALPLRKPIPPFRKPEAIKLKTSSKLGSRFLPTEMCQNLEMSERKHWTKKAYNINKSKIHFNII